RGPVPPDGKLGTERAEWTPDIDIIVSTASPLGGNYPFHMGGAPNTVRSNGCVGKVSFSEPRWVYALYPERVGGFSKSNTSNYTGSLDLPTQQQVDDAAYIMSTFVVK
ncbi:MAG: hypothetical protein RSF86_14715, partial [Angelakisella sp.]